MHKAPGKGNGQQGHDARDGEPNFERPVFLFLGGLEVVFVIGRAGKVTSLTTKVIIVTGRIPGITKALLDWHFVQLPRVELGMIRLGVVELAELKGCISMNDYIQTKSVRYYTVLYCVVLYSTVLYCIRYDTI